MIEQFQKDSTVYKSNPKRVEQKLKLEDYLHNNMSKNDRNKAILKAYQDGFMQSETAKFLRLSCIFSEFIMIAYRSKSVKT